MTIDAQILRALRQGGGAVEIPGADLARSLGVSPGAIAARIDELRSLGYVIEATPHRGYRLAATPDRLHADDLLARLDHPCTVGREIHVFQTTSSTSDIADRLARDGLREGVVVIAESQSRGRGRLGRSWSSIPHQGLWLSILLRPRLQPQSATRVMVAAATSLSRAVHRVAGCRLDIKWPNDLVWRSRKIAGILTEISAESDRLRYLILGVGINVNHQTADFPPELRSTAASLLMAAGRPIDRAELAAAFLRELEHDYTRVHDSRFSLLADEWARQCLTLGHTVTIQQGSLRIEGFAEALDEDGVLLLRTQHGRLERILSGDVSIVKPPPASHPS
ncbi:MAG TPA: biotin--[acetyl-CoA-carboxylase] ligase [Candidatus Paceibacterota bacterium]|nr:biotin--[acetyl-CoA-carboxylase] ligase [Verrucomicrobiota bacterium]HOX01781.1 biotin--[acetyl-CoA-carboxylase] ligase [Verrucomicrobiota bacterium]HRZ44568.1 biotin--[acetyl-CoA-carboxylase] ligase [Candidatus Paceibacterota bacterium]